VVDGLRWAERERSAGCERGVVLRWTLEARLRPKLISDGFLFYSILMHSQIKFEFRIQGPNRGASGLNFQAGLGSGHGLGGPPTYFIV
jgi:hypothetical protein